MSLLDRVKRVPVSIVKWLREPAGKRPIDLREFEESQRRLYEQSSAMQDSSNEFTRMVNKMIKRKRSNGRGKR